MDIGTVRRTLSNGSIVKKDGTRSRVIGTNVGIIDRSKSCSTWGDNSSGCLQCEHKSIENCRNRNFKSFSDMDLHFLKDKKFWNESIWDESKCHEMSKLLIYRMEKIVKTKGNKIRIRAMISHVMTVSYVTRF